MTGTLVRFVDLDTGTSTIVTLERAEVVVHGETVWVPADPGAYVLGGPVVVVTDGTGRPVRVTGPAGTVPQPVEGVPSPVVVHRPDLVIDEAARERNDEVAQGLDEARESLTAASGLIEAIRERVGHEAWVGPAPFDVDDYTTGVPFVRVAPQGDGRVRFTALLEGPHTGWDVGSVPDLGDGPTYEHEFTATGEAWVRVWSDGTLYQAPMTVTAEMLEPEADMWVDMTLSLDRLTESGGPLDPEVLSELWQQVVVAGFLVATEAIIAPEAIIDGAVQARHLDVVTDLPGGGAVSIQPDGLRMWRAGNPPTTGSPNVTLTTGDGFRVQRDDGTGLLWIDPATGDLHTAGAILSDVSMSAPSVTGGTFTGALFRTAASGHRWEIGAAPWGANQLIAFGGHDGEDPGSITTYIDDESVEVAPTGHLTLMPPRPSESTLAPFVDLQSAGKWGDPRTRRPSRVLLSAEQVEVEGDLSVDGEIHAPGLPYAQAAGTGSVVLSGASSGSVVINFPPGRFAQPPLVTANVDFNSQHYAIVGISNRTPTSVRIQVRRIDLSAVTVTVPVMWHAVQMTPTSAEG